MTTIKQKIQFANRSRRFNKRARRVLAGMKRTLPKSDRDLCDAYAVEVLGSKSYAPWLHTFANLAGQFREGWIPDNYFYRYVAMRSHYSGVLAKRPLAGRLLGLDHVPEIAALSQGHLVCADNEILHGPAIAEKLFADADRIIFKSDNSHAGLGVVFLTRDTFDVATLPQLGSGVFQKVIRQHEVFDQISPSSVATLRFTTVLDQNGEASLRGTHVGMSAKAGETHLSVSSAVGVTFDRDTGKLADEGINSNWDRIDRHPVTGQRFGDITVPNHAACARLVVDLHRRFPMLECIGWDMAIDHTGKPQVMEWNGGHVSVKAGEALQGPNFADLNWKDRWRDD